MSISRRTVLATGAAAIVTGATVPPLAIKAAGVRAALAGDPVLPAFEAFEAVRLEYLAVDNHIDALREAVEAEMPPEPHFGRPWLDLSVAERDEGAAWRRVHADRVEDRLGGKEDDIHNAYGARIHDDYHDLMDIQATTVAGLLCQVRAWWSAHEDSRVDHVPEPDPQDSLYDFDGFVKRVYHDIARLAGEAGA